MYSDKDYSYYDGLPKAFYKFKNTKFTEWEIPPWNLLIYRDKLLGEGEFGKVYLASWNETEVVAKVVNDNVPESKKNLFIKELDVLTKIHHPNIVQVMGYVSDPFIIVMEYLPNGELLDYVYNKPFLSNKKKIKICLDILRALTYLHNRQPNYIVHRDIKPQNIVMTPSGRPKIADFGISRIFTHTLKRKLSYEKNLILTGDNDKITIERGEEKDENDEFQIKVVDELTKNVGSIRYMAPEIKRNQEYDYKVDIWSAGIIFAELFENKRYNSDFYWSKTPKNIKGIIINHMLRDDSKNRLNAKDLINLFLSCVDNSNYCICF